MSRRFYPTDRWKRALGEAPDPVRQSVANILAAISERHPSGREDAGEFTASESNVVVAYRALADHPLIILLDIAWVE